jgi:hypothetical protein
VKPGRVFISRLLEKVRSVPVRDRKVELGVEFYKDLLWWDRFLNKYNGISIISTEIWSKPDEIVATDACLNGAGGVCFDQNQYFHFKFEASTKELAGHINSLEMLAIMVAVKLWGESWTCKKIRINCDNLSTAQVLNTGRTRDPYMLDCVREILFTAAVPTFEFRACHISGVENRLPDYLSRWYNSGESRRAFKRETANRRMVRRSISQDLTRFCNTW